MPAGNEAGMDGKALFAGFTGTHGAGVLAEQSRHEASDVSASCVIQICRWAPYTTEDRDARHNSAIIGPLSQYRFGHRHVQPVWDGWSRPNKAFSVQPYEAPP